MRNFRIEEIEDPLVRENFQRLIEFFQQQSLLQGVFKHFQITIPQAVTNYRYRHGLGFQPKDVIQSSLTGVGALTWNYASFDKEYVSITTTGPCVVRAFIGRYEEVNQ